MQHVLWAATAAMWLLLSVGTDLKWFDTCESMIEKDGTYWAHLTEHRMWTGSVHRVFYNELRDPCKENQFVYKLEKRRN